MKWSEIRQQYPNKFILVGDIVEEKISETRSKILEGNVLKVSEDGREIRKVYQQYKKNTNRRRMATPLGLFIEILRYKSKLKGKKVYQIQPQFTSQDDCRGLERGKRNGGEYIGVDNQILHADINAACNIAYRAKEKFKLNNPFLPFYARKNQERQVEAVQPIAFNSHC